MTGLEKFEKFNHKVSMGIEWVGLVALLLMMVITTLDVLGTKLFLVPVFGALDIMMIAQLVAMTFAAGATLIVGLHVTVEFFVPLLPARLQDLIDCIIYLLGLILFVLVVWRLCLYSYDLQIEGEVSSTARIPFYPFAYGATLACIPVCLIYACYFLKSLLKVFKR